MPALNERPTIGTVMRLARDLVPPIVTKAIRYAGRDALTSELKRLRDWPTGRPTVTSIFARPFHLTDGRDFVGLYWAYFQEQIYRFACDTERPYIIDCGAHIGVSVAWWKSAYPEARVLAFEADETNFALLERNCRGLSDIELVNAAVWSHEGEVAFAAKGGEGGHVADLSVAAAPHLIRPVSCVRLRPYLGEHCDLVKMDIEGAECEVLLDCADRLENVDRLFIEYHSFVGRDQLLGRTLSILESAGFRVHAHVAMPARRPFEELLVYNDKDLRLELFAFREGVRPSTRLLG